VTGPAVPVLQGVHTSPGLGGMVMTWFDVSDTGTLAYVPADTSRPDEQLLWVDLQGMEAVIAEGPGTWVHPRLSPNGSRISLDIHSADGMRDIYIYELERRQFQQLTHTGVTWESEWRPDGEVLAILSGVTPGLWSLYQVRTDFSGPPELLVQTGHALPGSWVNDGRALLYTEWDEGGIYRVQIEGERTPEPLLNTGRRQGFPAVSPDGKWMAYVADESSRREVFVKSYPDLGVTRKVSIEGGREPLWSHDGRRLFYFLPQRQSNVDGQRDL
jgi:Tol biopolymer transport system component